MQTIAESERDNPAIVGTVIQFYTAFLFFDDFLVISADFILISGSLVKTNYWLQLRKALFIAIIND